MHANWCTYTHQLKGTLVAYIPPGLLGSPRMCHRWCPKLCWCRFPLFLLCDSILLSSGPGYQCSLMELHKTNQRKKKEENGVHIPEWVIQQLHTQTPHSNIFTVLAAVDSNPTIWAAEKRGLGSSASNIIQEDSTTAAAKVGIAESWSTCSGAVENNWVEAWDM